MLFYFWLRVNSDQGRFRPAGEEGLFRPAQFRPARFRPGSIQTRADSDPLQIGSIQTRSIQTRSIQTRADSDPETKKGRFRPGNKKGSIQTRKQKRVDLDYVSP